jgi:hypothetical protein
VSADVADCKAKGLTIKSERKSVDESKIIKHIENLTDAEFEKIRYDPKFVFRSEGIEALMQTEEWSSKEAVSDTKPQEK